MGDSVLVVCVTPDAADTAFQIHCLQRSAYAAVLRAFWAQSNLLSRVLPLTPISSVMNTYQKNMLICCSIPSHDHMVDILNFLCKFWVFFVYYSFLISMFRYNIVRVNFIGFKQHDQHFFSCVCVFYMPVSYDILQAKHGCLVELRNELKILESEHRKCLGKARSNKQINSLR